MAEEKAPKTAAVPATTHRWNPLESLQRGWLLPDMLHEWSDLMERGMGLIRIERTTEDGQLVVRAELPGVDPDRDVKVSLVGDVLSIEAERRDERHTEAEGMSHSEFHYGRLTRALRLPSHVDPAAVRAAYKDGILEIRVPVPEDKPSGHQIPVQREQSAGSAT
jgi:HSP20 family protein